MIDFIKESLILVLKLEMGFVIELLSLTLLCLVFQFFKIFLLQPLCNALEEYEKEKDNKKLDDEVQKIKNERGWK